MNFRLGPLAAAIATLTLVPLAAASAQGGRGGDADLAQDLTNPVADLITVPIQMNYDDNIGPTDSGWKLQTNIQPVYPVNLSGDWNLITRTIVPVISQDEVFPGAGSQFGLGDITVSLFASPKQASGGVIWGVGPVFYLRTATDDLLGAKKWGAGPTGIVLTMRGRWTLGTLANHVWSFAGSDSRDDINNTFVQPFAAYTWPSAWTASLQSETNYNWEIEKWSIPVNFAISRLVRLGRLPVSLQAGAGYWLEAPDTGADGWRFRLQANFVLPKSRRADSTCYARLKQWLASLSCPPQRSRCPPCYRPRFRRPTPRFPYHLTWEDRSNL